MEDPVEEDRDNEEKADGFNEGKEELHPEKEEGHLKRAELSEEQE